MRTWLLQVCDESRERVVCLTVLVSCDPFALNGTERYGGRAAKVNDL